MRLEGHRAIVTGGASGIGAAVVKAFVEEGASVAWADLTGPAGGQASGPASGENERSFFLSADVSDDGSVGAMVGEAVERLGGLDILVNNAGTGKPGKLLDTEYDDWSRMLAVNLTGTFLVSKHALPHLLAEGGGSIINMASAAGLKGVRDRAAYSASKGGVISLTRSIALDYIEQGLRCNAICPATVDTPWVQRMISHYTDPEATMAAMVARQPMGRLGRPDEVAQAAVYLASPAAGFVTGTCLVIDGGFTLQ